MKCVLCGVKFSEWGNNPSPLASKGECCNVCNDTKVIPARIAALFNGSRNANEEKRNSKDPS
jgi:hypothetical protein